MNVYAGREREYAREYYAAHKEHLRERARIRYAERRAEGWRAEDGWTDEQKTRAAARKKQWQDQHRVRHQEANKRYRKRNPEKLRVKSLRWHQSNPEKAAAKRRKYHLSHPEIKRDVDQRRRTRTARGRGISTPEWREIKQGTAGLCMYCACKATLTIDHIEPIARGGLHDPDNVVPACKSCNSSKNDTPLLIWLARRAA